MLLGTCHMRKETRFKNIRWLIPHAFFFDLDGISDQTSDLPHTSCRRKKLLLLLFLLLVSTTRIPLLFMMGRACSVQLMFGGCSEFFGHDKVWVFVDHFCYHRDGNPYGDRYGAFGDTQFRFTLLCYAACEAPLLLPLGGYMYGQNCLFLVNDWHASLVPVLLGAKYRPHGVYEDARSILVIHNLAHQGVEAATTYQNLGLPPEWYGALEWVFPPWARTHALDKGEAVNILKGAAPEPRPEIRSGHIPKSKCIPFPQMLNGSQKFFPMMNSVEDLSKKAFLWIAPWTFQIH